MKKFSITAMALFLTQLIAAQISKDPGDFTKLKAYDRLSVELVPGDVNKVEITGNRASEVIVANKNGELKLGMPPQKLLQGEEIEIKLHYKKLTSLDASEGAYISSQAKVDAAKLEVTAKEGSEIKIEVQVEVLKVRAVTGATIRLTGAADEQNISIGTGGIVEAKDLKTRRTKVSINAGGEADVNASEFVEARTKAGGDITIFGNPQTIDKKSILGGKISLYGE